MSNLLRSSSYPLREQALWDAQEKAATLFQAIESQALIQAGRFEHEINRAIFDLAKAEFGVARFWHKCILRSGAHTLCGYREDPPSRQLLEDDIVFIDLGPVFQDWEADYGRTYVLGQDPYKQKIQADAEKIFRKGCAFYQENPSISAADLYQQMSQWAVSEGWTWGSPICGHLVGEFPHERIMGDHLDLYLHPDNPLPLRAKDPNGEDRFWILEVHLVDPARQIGAFYEALLLPERYQ